MEDRVSMTISEGVADVRLVRTDKMNALDPAMFDALIATLGRLQHETSVRAVVLSAEGKGFCAGIDTSRMSDGTKRDLVPRTHGIVNKFQKASWGWRELPMPVIAAVHGVAFGGGFQIALGADLRYLSPDARMSAMEIKWGLVVDMGGTVMMSHLCRDDVARELIYTGRIISAQEALTHGLATRVCEDPRGAAMETAREIAGKNPYAVRASKRMLNNLWNDPAPGLLAESSEEMQIVGSDNQREAVRANMEKRAPNFTD